MSGLVIGVGARRGVSAGEVLALVRATLREAVTASGTLCGAVAALATVDAKAAEPGIVGAAAELGVPLWAYRPDELAGIAVPHPSAASRNAVGTPSVAEAAALAGGGELLVPKRTSGTGGRPGRVTCAVARRADPPVPQPPYVRSGSGRAGHDPAQERRLPGRAAPPPPQGERVTSPPALLIAASGARHETAAETLVDFADRLGGRHPGVPVAAGLVGSGRRPLVEAVAELAAAGAGRLAAVPLALVPDGRAEHELDEALAAVCRAHPGLALARGRAIGTHRAVLEVLERRLDEALGGGGRTPRDRAGVTVLLVAPGSADPGANAEVHRVARLLWEGRGYAGVETAFVSTAAPDVPAGLDRCVRLGATRVVVLPYAVFDGGPMERARLQAEGWAEAHPGTEVRCAEVIGPAEELADLVVERYREAVAVPVPPQPRRVQDGHERAR